MEDFPRLFTLVWKMLFGCIKNLKFMIVIMLVSTLFVITFQYHSTAQAQSNADHAWPMYKQDPQRAARSPFTGPGIIEEPEVDVFIDNGSSFGAVTIDAEGIIYLGAVIDQEEGLYAYYPNGDLKWYYPLDRITRTAPAIGSDGTIFYNSAFTIQG